MDLTEFLAARLDEDEAAARDAYYEGQRWITEEEGVYRWPDDELVHMAGRKADARHIARHDPARVLREVEADWLLLADYASALAALIAYENDDSEWGGTPEEWAETGVRLRYAADVLHRQIKIRAAIYSDHPDYRPEWKPRDA